MNPPVKSRTECGAPEMRANDYPDKVGKCYVVEARYMVREPHPQSDDKPHLGKSSFGFAAKLINRLRLVLIKGTSLTIRFLVLLFQLELTRIYICSTIFNSVRGTKVPIFIDW